MSPIETNSGDVSRLFVVPPNKLSVGVFSSGVVVFSGAGAAANMSLMMFDAVVMDAVVFSGAGAVANMLLMFDAAVFDAAVFDAVVFSGAGAVANMLLMGFDAKIDATI